MATAAEVKKILKPLLVRHADLALVGRLIVVRPVRHHLRAVLVDRTSDRHEINPRWFINHLCKPSPRYHMTWGQKLYRRSHGSWELSKPNTQAMLIEEIEQNALPLLRSIDTFERYAAAASDKAFSFFHTLLDSPEDKLIVDLALGDIDAARAICAGPIASLPADIKFIDEEARSEFLQTKQMCELLAAGDRQKLVSILHDWELAAVRSNKLEHLWERTPLPIELGTA